MIVLQTTPDSGGRVAFNGSSGQWTAILTYCLHRESAIVRPDRVEGRNITIASRTRAASHACRFTRSGGRTIATFESKRN